ncbi:hypothetical protein [Methanofollis fontis]|uniref:Permease n=1 Tax=Methanofollis fontis TaxID=2052832 RepID=A0A483CQK4_9EURY|nr:hypothetical protein [Methanofollis fontis]TAJ45393.1 hypothetical protein CUJ86_01225 [Methanofollis fontis]
MKKQPGKQKKSGFLAPYLFLLCVVLAYAGVFIVEPALFSRSVEGFLTIFRNVLPVLVFVFALMFAVNLLIRPGQVARHLGQEAGLRGWVFAIVVGVLATGPIYLWYTLLADLQEKGMRRAFTGAFLYARSIKLPLIPLMIYYFGGLYTAVLTAYLILFSVVSGLVCERFGRRPEQDEVP